jgi:hypothetical protein
MGWAQDQQGHAGRQPPVLPSLASRRRSPSSTVQQAWLGAAWVGRKDRGLPWVAESLPHVAQVVERRAPDAPQCGLRYQLE